MVPQLELFGRTFSPYALSGLVGFLLALLFVCLSAKRRGLNEIRILYAALFSALGALIGAHLLYALIDLPLLWDTLRSLGSVSSVFDLLNRLGRVFGGGVFYGGLIGGGVVGWIYLRRTEKNPLPYANLGVTAVPLFHCFGRIGCFLAGCCFGVEWEHGIVFRHSLIEQANGVPRFPVQLCEAALNLGLFFLLWGLWRKRKMEGKLCPLYLMIYPAYRFGLEFLRGDGYRGLFWGLSTSQWISLILFIFGFFLLRKKKKAEP